MTPNVNDLEMSELHCSHFCRVSADLNLPSRQPGRWTRVYPEPSILFANSGAQVLR